MEVRHLVKFLFFLLALVCTDANAQSVGSAQTETGPITNDRTQFSVQLNGEFTAPQIYQMVIGCSSCQNADALRGVAVATTGSITSNVNGLAGYVVNRNPTGGLGQNAVSIFGVGVSAVDGAQTWGINTNLTDNTTQTLSTGKDRVLNNEYDFNVTSPNTQINGLVLQGASLAQPSLANGFVVSPLHIGFYDRTWSNAFVANDGASIMAMYVGTAGSPLLANANSQPLAFIHTDAKAVKSPDLIYDTPTGFVMTAGVNLNALSGLLLSANAGFVALPYTIGIPIGAPTDNTNCAIDTANGFLNCYYSGAWHKMKFGDGAG